MVGREERRRVVWHIAGMLLLPPSPVVSPSSGTYNRGQPVIFTLSGSQGDNWNNGNEVLIVDISPTANYQWNSTCNVQYRPDFQGGTVFLVTDNGNQPYPSGTIGAPRCWSMASAR